MFKSIKSLFVIEEEGAKKEQIAPPKKERRTRSTSSSQPVQQSQTTPQPRPRSTVSEGKVSTKFMDILFGAMEKNNIEGFDYLEFKKSLQSLAKMPLDEQTRFQSAFAMAQSMGVTPQRLIETAGHYLKILQQEEQKFEQALAKQKKGQIGNKEQQIQQLENVVKQKAAQIKKLTQEIEQHQKKALALKEEIEDKAVKIESTKNDFIASYDNLTAQIQKDVENMKNYLK